MNKIVPKLILLSFFIFIVFDAKAGRLRADLAEELKRAVISIKIMETRKAYGHAERCVGTGFLVDKEKGIILTNRHNAAVDSPANYEATWEDGSITDLNFPEIAKIKKFNYSVKDHSFIAGNNDILYTRQKEQSFYAYYKPEQYSAAVVIAFDKERGEWTRQTLDQ